MLLNPPLGRCYFEMNTRNWEKGLTVTGWVVLINFSSIFRINFSTSDSAICVSAFSGLTSAFTCLDKLTMNSDSIVRCTGTMPLCRRMKLKTFPEKVKMLWLYLMFHPFKGKSPNKSSMACANCQEQNLGKLLDVKLPFQFVPCEC